MFLFWLHLRLLSRAISLRGTGLQLSVPYSFFSILFLYFVVCLFRVSFLYRLICAHISFHSNWFVLNAWTGTQYGLTEWMRRTKRINIFYVFIFSRTTTISSFWEREREERGNNNYYYSTLDTTWFSIPLHSCVDWARSRWCENSGCHATKD